MKHPHPPGAGLLLAVVCIFAGPATLFAQSPIAVSPAAAPATPAECRSPPGAAGADVGELGCLTQAKRVELLTHPVEQAILPPLDRDFRLQSALHQLKAQEAEALAVPDPSAGRALDAYLNGRAVESRRSAALRNPRRELARSRARMVLMSADLAIAATAAATWVRRQPGRELPAAYRQRVAAAAAAILAEDVRRQRLVLHCELVNREYDGELRLALCRLG